MSETPAGEHSADYVARPVCDCAPDCAERIACEKVGELGHLACGWCEVHGQANHICLYLTRPIASAETAEGSSDE